MIPPILAAQTVYSEYADHPSCTEYLCFQSDQIIKNATVRARARAHTAAKGPSPSLTRIPFDTAPEKLPKWIVLPTLFCTNTADSGLAYRPSPSSISLLPKKPG